MVNFILLVYVYGMSNKKKQMFLWTTNNDMILSHLEWIEWDKWAHLGEWGDSNKETGQFSFFFLYQT